jgi:hypothetical protein
MAKRDMIDASEVKGKTKSQLRREAKKSALMTLIKFVNDSADDLPSAVKSALVALTPGTRTSTVTPRRSVIADLLLEKHTVDEEYIWANLKLGRAEMRKACVMLIKKAKPEDRVWIHFDAEKGEYNLQGTGPEAPAGWTGYRPVEVQDIEL